ncbi:MAG: maleylacetate reductase [Schumannella sp.]|nr:maleylacetate reductase [Schumannella sp.]
MEFAHRTLPQRVLFGSSAAAGNLAAEVARIGAERVMVIAATAEAELAAELCSGFEPALMYSDVRPHVPIDFAERASAAAIESGADLLVSVGGGSTTGLAKAIALTTGIPIVAVPTTYAGSEATNVWGLTERERKTTGTDDRVLPATVIYDAHLTLSLPLELSIASGMNAVAHCIDSLWAPAADPINSALAAEGIRALSLGMREIHAQPAALPGRERMLYGCYLAAVAFASAGSGLHHKLCHVLGGTFDLPHAQTHAAVLPFVLEFNAPAAPAAAATIGLALGTDSGFVGLRDLYAAVGSPSSLGALGFSEDSVAQAAEITLPLVPPSNPRPVSASDLEGILRRAIAGLEGDTA